MGRVATWAREHWFLLCCMAVAAAVAILVRDQVFPHYGPNRDEPVYVLQAETLRSGHLTLPRYPDLSFFQPWLTGVVDGRLIFEFPPGWPAFLAAVSLVTGSMVPALPIVAALVVLGMYLLAGEASGRRDVAAVAAAVTVLTPMVVIQSGVFVSYLLTLALGCFAGTALLRGARTGRAVPLVVGGLLLGGILLTRPLDALLWGLPFGVYVLLRAASGGRRATAIRALERVGWIAAGVVGPAICMAAYNIAVTGSPTRFPIEAADPLNRFGFGERRIMRGSGLVPYSGHDALDAVGDNFRHAPPWVLGSWIGITLACAGIVVARRSGAAYVMLGLIVTFTCGYFFYWGLTLMGAGAKFGGPQYYLPMVVPIIVLGATALVACWRWKRVIGGLVGAALVAVSIPTMVDRVDANRAIGTERFALEWDTIHHLDATNALVFIPSDPDPFILSYIPFAANSPDLDGDRVYAVDRAPQLVDLVDRTDRTPYRVAYENADSADGQVTTMAVRRLRVTRSGAFRVSVRVSNPGDASLVTAYLETPAGIETTVLDRSSSKGAAYDLAWTVVAPAHAAAGATTMPEGTGWLRVGVRFGPAADDVRGVDADTVAELRYATRTTAEAITAVVPARRFGLVDTVYGRIVLETPRDDTLRAALVPTSAE